MINPEMGPQEPEEEIAQEPEEIIEETAEEAEEIEAPEMSPEDFTEMLAQLPIMKEDLEAKKEELETARAAVDKDLEKIAELMEVIELLEDEVAAREEIQVELEE